MAITVTPSGAALGAEIGRLDLRTINDQTFAAVYQAWLDHQVLLFRDQHLTTRISSPSAAGSGISTTHRFRKRAGASCTIIPRSMSCRMSSRTACAIGSLGSGEAVWHTDMSYLADPPKASVLYALEVPETGGDTTSAPCTGRGTRCRTACGSVPPAFESSTTAPTTAAATCAQACRRRSTLARPRGRSIRWCAGMPRPVVWVCIWAAGAMPTSKACRSMSPRRC